MRLQLESTECCNSNAHVASHSFELLGPPGILGPRHSKRSVSSPKCWDMVIETELKSDQRPSIIRCITPSRPTSDTGCNPPNPKGSDSAVTTPTSPAFVPGGQGKRKIWPFSQGFGEGESEIGGGGEQVRVLRYLSTLSHRQPAFRIASLGACLPALLSVIFGTNLHTLEGWFDYFVTFLTPNREAEK